ncbi:hypothetical protein IW261DRAFT_1558973 [Armillaria novae-zelandiae]|uniref:RING-type domain-containing protein n=1 Tax=Armillaria novae-zelandiae TaxID=153914 RepID=A0AA39UHP4_9AGAR|nr:hypothetical protein IW261DRAFT_1558973 [Armillaria novae-zelandiae]
MVEVEANSLQDVQLDGAQLAHDEGANGMAEAESLESVREKADYGREEIKPSLQQRMGINGTMGQFSQAMDVERLRGESTQLRNERDDLQKRLSEVDGKLQSERSALEGELRSVRFELEKIQGERDFFVEHLKSFSSENLLADRDFLLSRLRQASQTEDLLHEENNTLKLQRDQAVSQLETAAQELKDLTCCPICMDGIQAPVSLKCGHDFCGACLFESNINSSPVFPRSLANVAEKMWGKPEGLDIGAVQNDLDNHAW